MCCKLLRDGGRMSDSTGGDQPTQVKTGMSGEAKLRIGFVAVSVALIAGAMIATRGGRNDDADVSNTSVGKTSLGCEVERTGIGDSTRVVDPYCTEARLAERDCGLDPEEDLYVPPKESGGATQSIREYRTTEGPLFFQHFLTEPYGVVMTCPGQARTKVHYDADEWREFIRAKD